MKRVENKKSIKMDAVFLPKTTVVLNNKRKRGKSKKQGGKRCREEATEANENAGSQNILDSQVSIGSLFDSVTR